MNAIYAHAGFVAHAEVQRHQKERKVQIAASLGGVAHISTPVGTLAALGRRIRALLS